MTRPGSEVRAVALYLPQFHPDPRNDQAWGPGFTEWHNVVGARPRFRGHVQPKLPGELGFYDLRLSATRERQAELAASAGIDAFAYYHYWFGDGRRALHRPFDEVLSSGRPAHGFCLVWANHDWNTATWSSRRARGAQSIARQRYSVEDVSRHFEAILPALRDERAVTVDGLPVFAVHDAPSIPSELRFAERFRELADRAGLAGLHLVAMNGEDPRPLGFDASHDTSKRLFRTVRSERLRSPSYVARRIVRRHYRLNYSDLTEELRNLPEAEWRAHSMVVTGWDDTARRGSGSLVVTGYEPDALADQVSVAVERLQARGEDSLLFVKSWNEWGEGNYLEPDADLGSTMLDAFGEAFAAVRSQR
ncbi:MAG: glycoside hydrolase family 99-like domain-containing protein [Ilumatobacter sp.]